MRDSFNGSRLSLVVGKFNFFALVSFLIQAENVHWCQLIMHSIESCLLFGSSFDVHHDSSSFTGTSFTPFGLPLSAKVGFVLFLAMFAFYAPLNLTTARVKCLWFTFLCINIYKK